MTYRIEIARAGEATSEAPLLTDSSAPPSNLAGFMANNTVIFESPISPNARLVATQVPIRAFDLTKS